MDIPEENKNYNNIFPVFAEKLLNELFRREEEGGEGKLRRIEGTFSKCLIASKLYSNDSLNIWIYH